MTSFTDRQQIFDFFINVRLVKITDNLSENGQVETQPQGKRQSKTSEVFKMFVTKPRIELVPGGYLRVDCYCFLKESPEPRFGTSCEKH